MAQQAPTVAEEREYADAERARADAAAGKPIKTPNHPVGPGPTSEKNPSRIIVDGSHKSKRNAFTPELTIWYRRGQTGGVNRRATPGRTRPAASLSPNSAGRSASTRRRIRSTAAAATRAATNVVVDNDTSGNFLSGFLGLHGVAYNGLVDHNVAAGHIHVGNRLPTMDAEHLIEATLTATLEQFPADAQACPR